MAGRRHATRCSLVLDLLQNSLFPRACPADARWLLKTCRLAISLGHPMLVSGAGDMHSIQWMEKEASLGNSVSSRMLFWKRLLAWSRLWGAATWYSFCKPRCCIILRLAIRRGVVKTYSSSLGCARGACMQRQQLAWAIMSKGLSSLSGSRAHVWQPIKLQR